MIKIRNLLVLSLIYIISLTPYNSAANIIEEGSIATKPAQDQVTEEEYFDDEGFDDEGFDDEDFELFSEEETQPIYDPYEKINRKVFAFNEAFDRYFFEHVAKLYRKGVPKKARKSIRNFLTNLTLPLSAINSLMQGKVDNSLATMSNFLINSTVGVLGIFDIAGEKNIRYNREDFGQTLGHYGLGSGAYLMIPVLGPSSTRDFGGWVTDKTIDPFGFNVFEIGEHEEFMKPDYRFALTVFSGVDTRESLIDILDDIRKDSFDPYATIRSAYLQRRENEVKN